MFVRDSDDAVKTHGRTWPAVVFAPLTIPALFVAEGVLLERINDIGPFVFMALAFSLPLSYLASLALGLPTFVWLRRHNLDRLWIMLALGLICGAVVLVGVMSFIGAAQGPPIRISQARRCIRQQPESGFETCSGKRALASIALHPTTAGETCAVAGERET